MAARGGPTVAAQRQPARAFSSGCAARSDGAVTSPAGCVVPRLRLGRTPPCSRPAAPASFLSLRHQNSDRQRGITTWMGLHLNLLRNGTCAHSARRRRAAALPRQAPIAARYTPRVRRKAKFVPAGAWGNGWFPSRRQIRSVRAITPTRSTHNTHNTWLVDAYCSSRNQVA